MVKPKTLQENTVIWAGMEWTPEGSLQFTFGPHGTVFEKNLKDNPALLIVSREALESNHGDLIASIIEPLSIDLAILEEEYARLMDRSDIAEIVKDLKFVIEYVEKLIEKLQKAETLESSIAEYQKGQELIIYLYSLIIDLYEQGLDSIVAVLESLIDDLSKDPIGDLSIYSEQDGEYIAAYAVSEDTITWKIPHFSIYYYRRR